MEGLFLFSIVLIMFLACIIAFIFCWIFRINTIVKDLDSISAKTGETLTNIQTMTADVRESKMLLGSIDDAVRQAKTD